MEAKQDRPAAELKVEGLDEPLRMTYSVFHDILRFVGTVDEALVSIMVSQDTRDVVLRRLLTDTSKSIESTDDLIPTGEMNIGIFEIDDVLAWVMEHVTYFFMNQSEKLSLRLQRFPEMAKKMSSSLSETGTEPLTESKKSAGPTE